MKRCTTITLAVLAVSTAFAQVPASQEPRFFKLEFTLRDLDGGKVISTRKYVMNVGSDQGGNSIRAGDKVPMHTGNPSLTPTQFSYNDIGVNIECRTIRELASGLALNISADISSTLPSPEGSTLPQIMRNNRWNSTVLVPLKKPMMVFSSDDPATTHQMQVEVLATAMPESGAGR